MRTIAVSLNLFKQYAVKQRLRYWASWHNQLLTNNLKYHSNSQLLHSLIKNNGVMIAATNSDNVDNANEQLDALINEYAKRYPTQANVLTTYYLKELPFIKKVEMSGLSKSTFYRYLTHAENWLARKVPNNVS